MTTITTVGYGDHYPVTTEGRLVAIILMTAGVGLFATLSGYLAATFLRAPQMAQVETELARLTKEIQALRQSLPGPSPD